jgi:hypothetical protein
MLLHQVLNVLSPTPAGQEVCTFQVVVVAAWALLTNGAATAAPVTPVRNLRRVAAVDCLSFCIATLPLAEMLKFGCFCLSIH